MLLLLDDLFAFGNRNVPNVETEQWIKYTKSREVNILTGRDSMMATISLWS